MLLVMLFLSLEEPARVERVVAGVLVRNTVEIVRPRFRDEVDRATAGGPVLGLESVGLDGKLGQRLDRRRVRGHPRVAQRPSRIRRNAVQIDAEAGGLTA